MGLDLSSATVNAIQNCILELDAWLDSMHLLGGYGGPSVGWNEECLDFNGPGLDWRYEGIISGYLNLWYATSNPAWIGKAQQAGNDLIEGQFQSGNFRNSYFEQNPNTGGTPHEAAVCLGLLKLSLSLRSLNDPTWSLYYKCAQKNLEEYQILYLWDQQQKIFWDGPETRSVSPDRLATLAEAFFTAARLSGQTLWLEQYALPSLDTILAHQITQGSLEGAIHWRSAGKVMEARFFPLLTARCIPGLMQGYLWTDDPIYAEAIRRSILFLMNFQNENGSFPQLIYANRKIQNWPAWVAGVGDILRALSLSWFFDMDVDISGPIGWLLRGRMDNGAIKSGEGFGRTSIPVRKDDPRDLLPSCGWVDKAFRFLSTIIDRDPVENPSSLADLNPS